MTEVGKVSGDKGPEGKKEKGVKGPGSDAFSEMMKIRKIRETDPEEKKKKKSRDESEEETKAQSLAPPPLKQGAVPAPAKGGDAPLKTKKLSGQRGARPPLRQRAPIESSGRQEPSRVPPHRRATPETRRREREPTTTSHRRDRERIEKHRTPQKASTKEKGKELPPSSSPKKKAFHRGQKAPFSTKTRAPSAETAKLPEKIKESKETRETRSPQVKEAKAPADKKTQTKKVETKGDVTAVPAAPTTAPKAPLTTEAPKAPATLAGPFAKLPAQMVRLYERMVGVITVLNQTGQTQTTIELTSPSYANSPFFGTKIVVTEYASAPNEYNIELKGSEQAVAQMNANKDELLAAFTSGGYNFKIHRVDASYLPPKEEKGRKGSTKPVKRKKQAGD